MRQAEMSLALGIKWVLPWFRLGVRQVLPEHLRLAVTPFGDFGVGYAIRVPISAFANFVVGRLRMAN